jgi:hypothetical protein
MWNEPTKEQLAKLPGLYETESVSLKDKLIPLEPFAEKELNHDTTQASS